MPPGPRDKYAPSVDRLFRSAAKHFGRDLVAIVLTALTCFWSFPEKHEERLQSLLAAFIATFPIVVGTAAGLHSADENARMLFKTMGASRMQTLINPVMDIIHESLTDKQREVLHLVFYQDLSVREAAEVMQVTVGTARVHYDRGKKKLRGLLADRDVQGGAK